MAADNKRLNKIWEQRIIGMGADLVRFVDITSLPSESTSGYGCAVLFGKALSKDYISTLRSGGVPEHREMNNTEHKMDLLAVKVARLLEAEGYSSIGKLKTGVLPHKTVALRAGLGFIGKNNLLVTQQYGCALILGKVLTNAPFVTKAHAPAAPRCGSCTACVDSCAANALLGKEWSITTTRDEMLTRKLCSLCLNCMVMCPYTAEYAE